MIGGDEIIFSGGYKGFRLGVRYDISGKTPSEVAGVLHSISSQIEGQAYALSGIDTRKVDEIAIPDGKGIAAVYGFLEARSSEWNKTIKGSLKDPKLMTVANSYLMNRLLSAAGVPFKAAVGSGIEPQKEDIGDTIAFIGKCGKWIAVKKLGLENVKDYEVSGILSGINHTAVNKGFDFAGMCGGDDIIGEVTMRKRKSHSNMAQALRELEPKLGGRNDPYLVCKTCEKIGFTPYASPGMLTDAYPDIKPPKVKGRKPKG